MSEKAKDLITKKVRKNGQTIRKVFEILTQMLKRKPFVCEACESEDIEVKIIEPDKQWIFQNIKLPRIRAPINKILSLKTYYGPSY